MRARRPIVVVWSLILMATLVACGGAPPTATPGAQTAATAAPTATTASGRTATVAAATGATTTRATSVAPVTGTRATGTAPAPAATVTRATVVGATATRAGSATAALGSSPTRAGVSATARASTYPLAVRDDAGRDVTVRARPQKIVSLAPSNTEILYALGLGDRVVGVDSFSDFPPEAAAKPKVGGFSGTNLEQVVALGPDLVLASGITSRDLLAALEGQGLTVIVLNPRDLPGVLENLSTVGQIADVNAEAARVRAGLQGRIDTVGEQLRGATPRPRVFFALDTEQFYTAGPNSFLNDLIVRAGGENIASDAPTPFPQLSPETIVAKDPEVVVVGDDLGAAGLEAIRSRPAFAAISAVRAGRVVVIDSDLTNRPGPRVVDGLEQLARLFHPQRFR